MVQTADEIKLKTHEKGASDPIVQRLAQQDTVPWYQKPNLRYLYLILFPTCMGIEITSGFDSQMINAMQFSEPWNAYFGKPQREMKGFIAASYSLGAICSLPFVPFINDRFGRRWAIFIGSCIMVSGAVVQCFAQNTGNYCFARAMLGFGIPMCIVAGSSLIGELGYPKERPVLTSLFNVSYFVGELLAAGIAFGTRSIAGDWSWRLPGLLQAAPSLLNLSLIFLVPESPRWRKVPHSLDGVTGLKEALFHSLSKPLKRWSLRAKCPVSYAVQNQIPTPLQQPEKNRAPARTSSYYYFTSNFS